MSTRTRQGVNEIFRYRLFSKVKAITAFALQCEKEFSIENLIGFIEFYQFLKDYVKPKLEMERNEEIFNWYSFQ